MENTERCSVIVLGSLSVRYIASSGVPGAADRSEPAPNPLGARSPSRASLRDGVLLEQTGFRSSRNGVCSSRHGRSRRCTGPVAHPAHCPFHSRLRTDSEPCARRRQTPDRALCPSIRTSAAHRNPGSGAPECAAGAEGNPRRAPSGRCGNPAQVLAVRVRARARASATFPKVAQVAAGVARRPARGRGARSAPPAATGRSDHLQPLQLPPPLRFSAPLFASLLPASSASLRPGGRFRIVLAPGRAQMCDPDGIAARSKKPHDRRAAPP